MLDQIQKLIETGVRDAARYLTRVPANAGKPMLATVDVRSKHCRMRLYIVRV
jgi:hypothetical protein